MMRFLFRLSLIDDGSVFLNIMSEFKIDNLTMVSCCVKPNNNGNLTALSLKKCVRSFLCLKTNECSFDLARISLQ
jgi:hypothetical protein